MSRENSGKREHQKIKPYIVLEYLMRNSDEQHAIPASDIVSYLQEDCGIDAERRSVYRDIDEINKVLYMLENECTIQEAEEVIDSEDGEEEKFIVYDKNKKGFYVRQRKYDANDIRLLAECVYSARFIDEKARQAPCKAYWQLRESVAGRRHTSRRIPRRPHQNHEYSCLLQRGHHQSGNEPRLVTGTAHA